MPSVQRPNYSSSGHVLPLPIWFPGGGSADPGVATPDASGTATPGLPGDGSNPGVLPDPPMDTPEWGQQDPLSDEHPFIPDESSSGDGAFDDSKFEDTGVTEGGGGFFAGLWALLRDIFGF
jgi:hypothetical protein